MNTELAELVEKVDSFFEKKGLSLDTKHNVSRLLTESYWDLIKDEGEEETEDIEEDDLFEDEAEGEDQDFIDGEEEIEEVPKKIPPLKEPVKKHNEGIKGLIKKPKISLKKGA